MVSKKYDLEKARAFTNNLHPTQPLIIGNFNPSSFADGWLFYNFILNPCHQRNIKLIISSDSTWEDIQQFGLSTRDPQIPIPHTWSKIEWIVNSYIHLLSPQDTTQFLKEMAEIGDEKPVESGKVKFSYKGMLDESQREAATTKDFATQVIAPAGSGKTKVIIARTQYLLDIGVAPEKILIATFNRKTKEELKSRLKAENMPENLSVYNFHALGRKILSEETRKTEVFHDRVPKIKKFIYEVSTTHKFNRFIDPKDVIEEIRKIKLNDLMSPEEYERVASTDFKKTISKIYRLYEDFKQENDLIDYDDMVFMSVKMLIKYKDIRERWQVRYSHILIDESQDIDRAQLIFMQILAAPQDKLFIVGDDDQAIYSWRSADVDRILDLDKEYPLINRLYLKYNYRCPANIVIAAKDLIENNQHRFKKEIVPKKNTGAKIEIIGYKSSSDNSSKEIDEAATDIIKMIKEEIQNSKKLEDFTIVSRTHAQLIPLEMACVESNVPFYLGRENRFLELPEIKTLQSYLTFINDFPERIDLEILRVILRRPNKYVSKSSIQQISKNFKSTNDLKSIFSNIKTDDSQIERLVDFAQKIDEVYSKSKDQSVYEAISLIRQDLGLDEYFIEQQKQARENDSLRIENMDKYQSMSSDYKDIKEFLEAMNSLKEKMKSACSEKKGICLQTIHASKGLESPNLFIFGMDDEHMPHRFSLKNAKDSDKALEEERRLAYVAITRARSKLYLCVDFSKPSRFIAELFPKEALR